MSVEVYGGFVVGRGFEEGRGSVGLDELENGLTCYARENCAIERRCYDVPVY